MSAAIIDINDIGLRCFYQDRLTVSPGFALLSADGVVVGEAAQRQYFLQPQQSFNQYWRQLNLSPLSATNKFARHHADLAYAQLLQLHTDSGAPEQVIFSVPGSFTDDQLGVLLGLGNALPFTVTGLVDSAVLSCTDSSDADLLYIDMQLHQTVLTRLSNKQGYIERVAVELLADTGLKAFYDAWAHHIADQYIRQYRYDPLHTAGGEQQLYDKLPEWVALMQSDGEPSIALETTQGELRLNISRSDLLQSSNKHQHTLSSAVDKLSDPATSVCHSHHSRRLIQQSLYGNELESQVMDEQRLAANALASMENLSGSSDIHFITRLPAIAGSGSPGQTSSGQESFGQDSCAQVNDESVAANVSHILISGVAYPIGQQLALKVTPGGIVPSDRGTNQSDLLLLKEGNRTVLKTDDPTIKTEAASDNLQPGDTIYVSDIPLQVIEVR